VLPLSARSTTELVEAIRSGGRDAQPEWNELIERYKRVVWKSIRSFDLRAEERSDAFQATWLRLLERIDQVREPERLAGWLATTATNEVRALLRRTSRVTLIADVDDRPSTSDVPGAAFERTELADAVQGGFARLPERCQQLLRLLTVDPPLSYSAIEELMDMKHGSIGPTRRRCLDSLRKTPDLARYLGIDAGRVEA
jgi:RNA polymerase sigma factor (sigma-70 family)